MSARVRLLAACSELTTKHRIDQHSVGEGFRSFSCRSRRGESAGVPAGVSVLACWRGWLGLASRCCCSSRVGEESAGRVLCVLCALCGAGVPAGASVLLSVVVCSVLLLCFLRV